MNQLKIIIGVAILAIVCVSIQTVHGKPSQDTADNIETDRMESSQNRTKRGLEPLAELGGKLAAESIINSGKCSTEAGCHKGYCWAWCGVSLSDGEWCYTTKTYSQSYKYVKCKKNSDCDACWKCGGPCALF